MRVDQWESWARQTGFPDTNIADTVMQTIMITDIALDRISESRYIPATNRGLGRVSVAWRPETRIGHTSYVGSYLLIVKC
jgi:hypothetical protein